MGKAGPSWQINLFMNLLPAAAFLVLVCSLGESGVEARESVLHLLQVVVQLTSRAQPGLIVTELADMKT